MLTAAQRETQEWWKRHKDFDFGDHTIEEIEDVTGCVPLLLTDAFGDGKMVNLSAPKLIEVGRLAQRFVDAKWEDFGNIPTKWER
jgi:hypothetical protein